MEIGAQFYTLREHCTNLEDFALSLKRVADIGYKVVQISGACDFEPEWLDEQLKLNGLKCVLTHYSPKELKESTEEVVKRHNIFCCKNIGIGCVPDGFDEKAFDSFTKEYKECAKTIKELGSQLFYHNHHFEFARGKDGQLFLDKLLNAFDENELQITLDTYWVQYGGADVCDVIDKLKGRLTCVHLKDLAIVDTEQRMAPIGRGNLNFKKILKHLEAAGCKYALVEQDFCYGEDPFDCLKESYDYLRKLL